MTWALATWPLLALAWLEPGGWGLAWGTDRHAPQGGPGWPGWGWGGGTYTPKKPGKEAAVERSWEFQGLAFKTDRKDTEDPGQ